MSTGSRSPEEIKASIEANRAELAVAVETLRGEVAKATDWRAQLKAHKREVIIGAVTLVHDFPTATIVWLVVLLVYQQVENNVLQPLIYRKTVDVSPLLVIVSILIGSTLLGVLGALVAIPVAAAAQIVVRDIWKRREPAVEVVETPGGAGP